MTESVASEGPPPNPPEGPPAIPRRERDVAIDYGGRIPRDEPLEGEILPADLHLPRVEDNPWDGLITKDDREYMYQLDKIAETIAPLREESIRMKKRREFCMPFCSLSQSMCLQISALRDPIQTNTTVELSPAEFENDESPSFEDFPRHRAQ